MTESKLATFRTDAELWASFQKLCKSAGSNASSELNRFIAESVERGVIGATAHPDSSIDNRIDDLQDSIDSRIDLAITAAIAPLKAEIEALKKPEATAA